MGDQAERFPAIREGTRGVLHGCRACRPTVRGGQPCARTAWRTHPLGQTPIVTAGCGLSRVGVVPSGQGAE